jgi:hypothetical protein
VWDEPIELRLPPPLADEQPLPVRVRVMAARRLLPDRFLANGTALLNDLLYGGGQHELAVPLTDKNARPAGHLHLGLLLRKEAAPGEEVGERGWPARVAVHATSLPPFPPCIHARLTPGRHPRPA